MSLDVRRMTPQDTESVLRINAAITWRCRWLAAASRLRIACTRQRCQLAP